MAGTVRKRTWITGKGEPQMAWLADYFDQYGERHRKQFATKCAADSWLLQTRSEVRDGIHTPDSSRITVKEAGALWLQRAAAERPERGSQRTYGQMVRLAIEPLLGETRFARLTRPMVESFRDDLLKRFSRVCARRALSVLRMILDHAQHRGLLAQNVARGVRIAPRARLQEQLIIGRSIPTPEEIRQLLAAADGRLHVMITTAAFTGMRQSELRGLQWQDVDLAGEHVTVRQRADQRGALGRPKSKAGQRTIARAPHVSAELLRWRLACGHPEIVFPGRTELDRAISQSGVSRFCQAADSGRLGAVRSRRPRRGRQPGPAAEIHLSCAAPFLRLGDDRIRLHLEMAAGHDGARKHRAHPWYLWSPDGERARMAAFETAVLGSARR